MKLMSHSSIKTATCSTHIKNSHTKGKRQCAHTLQLTERLELFTELTRNNKNGQSIWGIIGLTKCRLFSSSFLLRIFSIRSSRSKVSCLVRDIASIFVTYYRYIRPFAKTKIPHFTALKDHLVEPHWSVPCLKLLFPISWIRGLGAFGAWNRGWS